MGLGGSLKSTDDTIRADKSLKRPPGIDKLGLDIKDVKNRCSFSEGSTNQYMITGLSSAIYW